jgi:hypothetical protein
MAFSYRQVSDLYKTLKDAGVVNNDLPSWSSEMNRLSGSDLYSQGLNDNFVKRSSANIDRALEWTGLPKLTGEFGASVGGLVGNEEAGRSIGEGLPRMGVNFAPLALAEVATAGGATPFLAGALGLGATGALSGADTYEKTGSGAAGLISAATNVAMPGVAGLAERATLQGLGAKLVEGEALDAAGQITNISQRFPTRGQSVASFLAGQGAAAGLGEVSGMAQAGLDPNSDYHFSPTSALLNMTLGQLPFAAAHLAGKVVGRNQEVMPASALERMIALSQPKIAEIRMKEAASQRSPIEEQDVIPDELRVADPKSEEETANTLAALRGERKAIVEKGSSDDVVKLDQIDKAEADLIGKGAPDAVFGEKPTPVSERFPVTGTVHFEKPNWRIIKVSETPENLAAGFKPGQLIGFSTKFEPSPMEVGDGVKTFQVPTRFHDPNVVDNRAVLDAVKIKDNIDNGQPDLPLQEHSGLDRAREEAADFKRVQDQLDAVPDGDIDALRESIVAYNGVREQHGLPPLTDEQLTKADSPLAMVKGDMNRVMLRIARKEEVLRNRNEQTQMDNQTLAALLAQEKKDGRTEIADMWKATDGGRPGTFAKVVAEWVKDGTPGDIEGLRARALKSKAVGGAGKPKVNEVVEKTAKAAKSGSTFSKDIRESVARAVAEDTMDEGDVNEFAMAYADGSIELPSMKAFRELPHIARALEEANGELAASGQHLPEPNPVPKQAAGGNFVWDFVPYDEGTNKLGKHGLPKTGIIRESAFKNMAGDSGPLSDMAIALGKEFVPEAFKDGNVDVKILFQALKEKGPVVEVKKLEGPRNNDLRIAAANEEMARIQHEMDTRFPGWQGQVDAPNNPPALEALLNRYYGLAEGEVEVGPTAGARYSFLGPKSEHDMPGYVEGLVRVPTSKSADTARKEGYKVTPDTDSSVKYSGPHFGSEDTNVLAFFRGYEEMVDGKKVFHVIEVQSDWGQARRKTEAENKRTGQEYPPEQEAQLGGAQDHPLLSVYEPLALKAAIDHAMSIGADSIMLSDGETAMMTEGHDKIGTTGWETTDGNMPDEMGRPKQEKGMRLHYDQTLPSAMKKLTGDSGKVVEVGTHAKGVDREVRDDAGRVRTDIPFETAEAAGYRVKPQGSPVFRNLDGTPKSNITGRLYDLTQAKAKLESQGGFTLTNPSRISEDAKPTRIQQWVPKTAREQKAIADFAPDDGGMAIIRRLKQSGNLQTIALAHDLEASMPETLKRVFVQVMDMSSEGYARSVGNRETLVQLSHGILLSHDSARVEEVMTHELLHGLTLAELDNSTKRPLVQELDKLRERLISKLPVKVRTHLDSALASDWMNRFASSDQANPALMSELGPSPEWQQVVYGLLNNKELISQGFANKDMKKFLRSLDAPGARINAFYNWVKKMVGIGDRVTDNEFARLMDVSSRLMAQGEYVADFSNFTDHYFAEKGMSPGQVRLQSQRALEIVQGSKPFASKEGMFHTLSMTESPSQGLKQARKEFDLMVQEKGDDMVWSDSILADLGHSTASIDAMLSEHLTDGLHKMGEALDALPDSVTKYLFEKVRDMKQVLGGVAESVSEKNDGLLNISEPKELRKPVKEALKSLDKMLAFETKLEVARTQLAGIVAPPDAFFNSAQSVLSRAPKGEPEKSSFMSMVGEAIGSHGGRWAAHLLEQPAQIARSNPIFGEWYSRIMLMNAKARNMAQASYDIYSRGILPDGGLTSEPVKAESERVEKALKNPRMVKGLNDLIYIKNKMGKDAVGPLDYNHLEVQKILSKLTAAERADVITLDNKMRLATVSAHQQTLESLRQDLSMRAARLPMRDEGMKLSPAVDASTKLFDALNADFNEPRQAAEANANLAAIQSRMQPQSFNNLLNFVKNSVEQHKTLSEYLVKNSDWVSAQRMKDFTFEYQKNGKTVKASANTMKEAKEMTGGRPVENWKKNDRSDDDSVFLGDDAVELITKMRQYEDNQYNAMREAGTSEADLAKMRQMSPVAQIERDTNARGMNVPTGLKGRTLSRGAEELPWFENHLDWIQKNAVYWQRRLLRTTAESMRLEPGTIGSPTADLIGEHLEAFMQRDPELGRRIQQVASTWSLGFNVATQIANSTQTYMRGVTELIALGHSPLAALSEMTGAWKDLAGRRLEDQPWRTKSEEKFMKDAGKDGQLSASMMDEEAAIKENTAVNFKRILNGGKAKTLGQHLDTGLGAYTTAGMWMFKHGEYANNKAQLLATFRTLTKLSPELRYEELKKQSYLVNASVNDVGGRANRSIGLYSGKGDFARTAAMTATSLQSYLLGSTMQLVRNLKKGLFRPVGVTPAEVYAARKAAIYQLGVQFAAAGTLGMPFVSGALALLDQAFPELEVNKKVRESVAGLFGDSSDGQVLNDIAMSGVPSMMGWDFSSRLNAGNLLPGVSEYNGFQPQQLLGVPASLVANFLKGGSKLASGDLSGGYAFVPPAFQKISRLVGTGGKQTDYRGRPVLDPTVGETTGLALGFQPTRLKNYNTASRLAEQSEHLAIVRQGQENQKLAEEALKGNFGTVRNQLQQKSQLDKSYNSVDAVRAIARAAEEMAFPKDLRREGSSRDQDSRSKLLSSFSLDQAKGSEVDRLKFRKGIEQRLGLNHMSPSELTKAQLMDQLRAKDPMATRSQLSAAAQAALRRTAPQTLQESLP